MKKRTILAVIFLVMVAFLTGCDNKKTEEINKNNDLNNQKEEEQKANTNPGIISDQTLGDITIEQTSLVFKNGTSTLTTNVKNNSNQDIVVNGVKIIFKDSGGDIIVTLDGYIGSNIEPGKGKLLTTHVDQNLMHAASVEYELIK